MASSKANLSYWEQQSFFKDLDVVIIGSGIVGINAALHLKERDPSLRVVVVDRGILPMGASTRNAGFACFGSLSELLDDLDKHSESEVFELVEKRWRGLQKLRGKLGTEGLAYREWGGYELFREEDLAIYQRCKERMNYFNQQLEKLTGQKQVYQLVDERIENFGFGGVSHLILNRAEGQIHTGKMMQSLLHLARKAGIEILNGLTITDWEEGNQGVDLYTDRGWRISTQKMLIATNGFARQLLPDIELQAARNQVLITCPIENLPFKGCFHYDRGYYYFRNIDQRILLGGGRNLALETEQTTDFGTTPLITQALRQMLRTVILPGREIEIEQYWSGILGVGQQKKAIIKQISTRVFAAVRMGGMGVAIGCLVGEEGAELML